VNVIELRLKKWTTFYGILSPESLNPTQNAPDQVYSMISRKSQLVDCVAIRDIDVIKRYYSSDGGMVLEGHSYRRFKPSSKETDYSRA